jgi:uroporphyrinogen decarboxylase
MGGKDEINWGPALDPYFEARVLEETENHIIKRNYDGTVIKISRDNPNGMFEWLDFPVKNRREWQRYKKRLNPHSPGRFPKGWDLMTRDNLGWPVREEIDGKHFRFRDFAVGMACLTLFGGPRYYLGLENICLMIYDDIAFLDEIMEWHTHLCCEMLKKVFASGVDLDWVWFFEDICYKNGPLVSPEFVNKHMAPRYRRVVDLARGNGVEVIIMDSDGQVAQLLPIWLDCGINAIYPLEVASGVDGMEIRKKYGNNFVLIGNVDKRSLAKGRKEIDEELGKAKALLKTGGYFPGVDHHIPPDVPYENFLYFINNLRASSDDAETRRQIPGS